MQTVFVAPSGGITYYHQFLLEQAYETTKVRDETTDSNIGTISGDTTFVSTCGSNGADFDGNADYISFAASELSNITNLNKQKIRFSYTWDGANQQSNIFYQWNGSDGPRLIWQPTDSRWYFVVYEGGVLQLTGRWTDADAASETCEYYEVEWDYNNTESTLTLYKGSTFDNMTLQTISDVTLNEGTGTISLVDGFSISSDSTSQSCVGAIGEFSFINPN